MKFVCEYCGKILENYDEMIYHENCCEKETLLKANDELSEKVKCLEEKLKRCSSNQNQSASVSLNEILSNDKIN